jgi:hypothetical protein
MRPVSIKPGFFDDPPDHEQTLWGVWDADSAPLSAKLLRNSTLKTYKGFPHGMPTTEADTINADLLTFLKGAATTAAA